MALKILAPALAADEAFRQRFIRESRAAAAVDDPHIIPVFEAGEASGVLFIAMRYVSGGDVGTLVARSGPMPAEEAAGIVSQVASALDAAHARGLVHRDVKPTNMLLDAGDSAGRPDHVYLSDFGLSKGQLTAAKITATGQFLGTLDYMSPEQVNTPQVGPRSDQYSLACAAFELLAGTPPFERDTAMAVMYAHAHEPPPALTGRRPGLPATADAAFARALAKAPEDRYATCREFADALREALGLQPYRSGPRERPASAPTPRPTLTEVVADSNVAVSGPLRDVQYGIVCRDSGSAEYIFQVQGNRATIAKFSAGTYTPLRSASAGLVSVGRPNQLSATCENVTGQQAVRLTFSVNGTQVVAVTDRSNPLDSGTVGIFANFYHVGVPNGVEAAFQNFEVRQL